MNRPAPLACVECRRSHLKCDGVLPACTRCATNNLTCGYTPSRRGRGRRTLQLQAFNTRPIGDAVRPSPFPLTPTTQESTSSLGGHPTNSPTASAESEATGNQLAMPRTCGALSDASRTDHSTARPPRPYRNGFDKALFIKAFYTHFHPNHPFLVPQPFYSTQQYPDDLDYVVCLIGQFYLLGQSDDGQIDAEVQTLSGFADAPATLASLQTLLLCSIVLHSLHRPDETDSCLKRAQEIAQELFSNSATCASLTTVEEESMRRTWWELYTVDTYLAALHRRPAFINDSDAVPPALPGATKIYNAGAPDPNPPSLAQMERRVFSEDPITDRFSPFCYRIESIRLLRRVLKLSDSDEVTADAVEAVDNALASWKHYLPEGGAMLSEDLNHLDALYFQAHSFVHTATILIHFPRSDLPANVPSAKVIFCIANHPRSLSVGSQHTMKAIAASKEIANMVAMPMPAEFLSPLFVCALNLACIVQLAAGIKHIADPEDTYLQRYRDRVRLLLGVLSQMGRRWRTASHSATLLKRIADTIFASYGSNAGTSTGEKLLQDRALSSEDDLWSNLTWLDLFSPEEMNRLMEQSESSVTL